MKSVDQDFDPKGYDNLNRIAAYVLFAAGSLAVLIRLWEEVHLRGLSFHTLIQIFALPLVFTCPLILSLRSRRYIRSALEEGLVSERVVKNCEYLIGTQLSVVYFTILLFAAGN